MKLKEMSIFLGLVFPLAAFSAEGYQSEVGLGYEATENSTEESSEYVLSLKFYNTDIKDKKYPYRLAAEIDRKSSFEFKGGYKTYKVGLLDLNGMNYEVGARYANSSSPVSFYGKYGSGSVSGTEGDSIFVSEKLKVTEKNSELGASIHFNPFTKISAIRTFEEASLHISDTYFSGTEMITYGAEIQHIENLSALNYLQLGASYHKGDFTFLLDNLSSEVEVSMGELNVQYFFDKSTSFGVGVGKLDVAEDKVDLFGFDFSTFLNSNLEFNLNYSKFSGDENDIDTIILKLGHRF